MHDEVLALGQQAEYLGYTVEYDTNDFGIYIKQVQRKGLTLSEADLDQEVLATKTTERNIHAAEAIIAIAVCLDSMFELLCREKPKSESEALALLTQ